MNLKIKNINKKYGNKTAVDGVTALFLADRITGLIGFNGSGKTTIFNIITNLISHDSGNVCFDYKENQGPTIPNRNDYKRISYISADKEYKNTSKSLKYFLFIAALYDVPKNKALEQINKLTNILDFNEFINKRISTLSKGNRQKVEVIVALLNPKLEYLLLDEPFDGLDPLIVNKLKTYFINNKKNIAIIITSHRMDIVNDMCDAYYILKEGKIIEINNNAKKHNNDDKVRVSVNAETNIESLKTLKFIVDIKREDNNNWLIIINNLNDFKTLSEHLLKCKGYIHHSILKYSLNEVFIESYNEGTKNV